jgi:CRISPR-associated protein Cas5h
MKILVFDINGDYAHFRKYYTTTSPLTFSFPPPPTIAGIIGAIYGIPKNENLKIFGYDNCQVALQILNPVKKVRMGVNLINTKDNKYFMLLKAKNHEPRTQIRTEFVKSPKYRIYVKHKDKKIFNELAEFIKLHKSFYTVSLGLSELLANFSFVGLYDYEEIKNFEGYTNTVIPLAKMTGNGILIETDKKYFKEKIPIKMNPDRVVEIYGDVVYEPDGKSIKANVETAYHLENGETITFF